MICVVAQNPDHLVEQGQVCTERICIISTDHDGAS